MSLPVAIPHAEGAHARTSDDEDAGNSCDSESAMPDEYPELSEHAAAALREFLSERERTLQQSGGNPFDENWGLSQFWYTPETAQMLASAVERVAGTSGRVACIACPSLFRELADGYPEVQADLFEIDPRFEALGNFHIYDFNEPNAVDDDLKARYELIVVDPPYLSHDCLEKMAVTVRLLAHNPLKSNVILLTGFSMLKSAASLLNVRPVTFRPQHKSKLGNEFLVYTNIDLAAEQLGGYDTDVGVE